MKTPDYMLTEDFTIYYGPHDSFTMAAGTFVKPIYYGYVPKHVTDHQRNRDFNRKTDVYVYSYYGIHAVPQRIVRQG